MKHPHEHFYRHTSRFKIYAAQKHRSGTKGQIYEYREHVCIYCGAVDWRPQGGEK